MVKKLSMLGDVKKILSGYITSISITPIDETNNNKITITTQEPSQITSIFAMNKNAIAVLLRIVDRYIMRNEKSK
jgi:hypothetical protein